MFFISETVTVTKQIINQNEGTVGERKNKGFSLSIMYESGLRLNSKRRMNIFNSGKL